MPWLLLRDAYVFRVFLLCYVRERNTHTCVFSRVVSGAEHRASPGRTGDSEKLLKKQEEVRWGGTLRERPGDSWERGGVKAKTHPGVNDLLEGQGSKGSSGVTMETSLEVSKGSSSSFAIRPGWTCHL